MKKQITTASLLLASLMFMASCGSENPENKKGKTEQAVSAMYQCPMKCEGEKMYDKPGQCPVCKMDLDEVKAKQDHDSTHTNH